MQGSSVAACSAAGEGAGRAAGGDAETDEERFLREAREKAVLNAQLLAARLKPTEQTTLSQQGQVISQLLSEIAAEGDEDKLTETVSTALQGLDLNAQFQDSSEGEQMTCGQKLAIEIIHLPQASGPFKMALVEELVRCGLDVTAQWRDGRSLGTCGCTLLSGVFWLQGIEESAKLELVKKVLEGGLQVNTEYVERVTKASCGTFLMAGATSCARLEGASKVALLQLLLEAGMDLQVPCQQGRTASTCGSIIAQRLCSAVGTQPNHQADMLLALARGGWRMEGASAGVKAHVQALLSHPDVDQSVRDQLREVLPAGEGGQAAISGGGAAIPGEGGEGGSDNVVSSADNVASAAGAR